MSVFWRPTRRYKRLQVTLNPLELNMQRHVLILTFLILLLTLTGSKSYAQVSQPSTRSVSISTDTLEKAMRAAREIEVSRPLILAQAQEIEALKVNSSLKDEKISLLQSIVNLKAQQLTEKDKVISSLEAQKTLLVESNTKLEKSNKKLRKLSTILGITSAIAGFIIFR